MYLAVTSCPFVNPLLVALSGPGNAFAGPWTNTCQNNTEHSTDQ